MKITKFKEDITSEIANSFKNSIAIDTEATGLQIPERDKLSLIQICDEDQNVLTQTKTEVVTAFEILEHLLSPYQVLKSIQADKLVVSIPLKLWFAPAYRSKIDKRDRHFHEFEDWQFDWLLEKTGWKIIASEKWINLPESIGFRSLLRCYFPRHYIVYAKKVKYSS